MRLEAVSKRYGLRQPWVVRDVTREVAAGQLIRLEGPNGSGKSTLLRVLAGVTRPTAGRVTGRPHTGYVPERFPGGLGFSARDYLQHLARIHGLSGAAVDAAVDEWLGRLGAADYAGTPLRTLSKGMCQKVAIAQALLAGPDLLVLDEAWTGLDQAARAMLDAAVAERVAAGAIVVFVDHDQARLAGQVGERWQIAAGTVSAAEPGPVLAAFAPAAPPPAASASAASVSAASVSAGPGGSAESLAAVVIELTGLESGSLARLAQADGVLAVTADSGGPVPDDEPGRALGLVTLTVDSAASDELLRQLLGWDGVHVLAVRPAAGQPSGPPPEGRAGTEEWSSG
ncbi:MAG: ABC transporter ATP-binding protein [Streptosporangiaceae bacterium]